MSAVYAATVQGVTAPWTSLRPLSDGDTWARWCEQQGIDSAYVCEVVVEEKDGELTARCTRWVRDENGRVKAFPSDEQGRITRTHVTEHPVTSIQILLDQMDPEPVTV